MEPMNEKRSSTTAEGVALVRAIEAQRPEGKRICHDPIAQNASTAQDELLLLAPSGRSPGTSSAPRRRLAFTSQASHRHSP